MVTFKYEYLLSVQSSSYQTQLILGNSCWTPGVLQSSFPLGYWVACEIKWEGLGSGMCSTKYIINFCLLLFQSPWSAFKGLKLNVVLYLSFKSYRPFMFHSTWCWSAKHQIFFCTLHWWICQVFLIYSCFLTWLFFKKALKYVCSLWLFF